jgi:hypothetical protein
MNPNEEIAMMRQDYATLRHYVRLALDKRKAINVEFGLDDDEAADQLQQLLFTFKEEERILLEMLDEGDVVSDPLLHLREAKEITQ